MQVVNAEVACVVTQLKVKPQKAATNSPPIPPPFQSLHCTFFQAHTSPMAAPACSLHCQLRSSLPDVPTSLPPASVSVPKLKSAESPKIVLQPRLCTLRSFGSDPIVPIKAKRVGDDDADVSPFFATLSEYIKTSKDSHEFEIISGRLAMIVFAATVTMEVLTGNSVFRKMDLEGIEEAAGICLGAVIMAAIFAFSSNARNRVGRIFSIGCNTFIDSLIDQIVDGLFYEINPGDWSDDI